MGGALQILTLAPVALLASCSGGRGPDFYVHGTAVIVATSAPFASRPDLPARVESTIGAALAYWGGSWEDLDGVTLTLEGEQYVACAATHAIGCNDGDIRVSTRDPSLGPWQCVEQTVLVHEVGHSVIGDAGHADPRWMDFAAVLEALTGRTGYSADGELPCALYPSVWRHVLTAG
ncbi:MAG TPA: hypothetical protein VLT47_12225 [Anaeromyxobacteraceae bacterium]|nr:hypothetical protein [Anaeromyxobacteraceae bacterium]